MMIHRRLRQPKRRLRTFVVSSVAAKMQGRQNYARRQRRHIVAAAHELGPDRGQASEETRHPSRIRGVSIRTGTRSIEAVEAADGYMADVQRRLFGAAL